MTDARRTRLCRDCIFLSLSNSQKPYQTTSRYALAHTKASTVYCCSLTWLLSCSDQLTRLRRCISGRVGRDSIFYFYTGRWERPVTFFSLVAASHVQYRQYRFAVPFTVFASLVASVAFAAVSSRFAQRVCCHQLSY